MRAGIRRALRRLLGRQQPSVVVTSARGAAEILRGLNEALLDELRRERARADALEAKLAALQRERADRQEVEPS